MAVRASQSFRTHYKFKAGFFCSCLVLWTARFFSSSHLLPTELTFLGNMHDDKVHGVIGATSQHVGLIDSARWFFGAILLGQSGRIDLWWVAKHASGKKTIGELAS